MPHLRRRFPQLYRFAAFLALWAMLVPVFTTLVHHPASTQTFLRICGSEQPTGDHGKAPAKQMPDCPLCQGLHLLGGGLVPPDNSPVAEITFAAPLYTPLDRVFILEPHIISQAQPRAPPAFV